jgi:hypothetical protein
MTPASVAVLWRAEEARKTPPRLGPLWGFGAGDDRQRSPRPTIIAGGSGGSLTADERARTMEAIANLDF